MPAPRAGPGGHGGLQVRSRFWTGRCADRNEGADTHVPRDCSPESTLTLLLCPEHSLSPPQARTSPLCRPFPADPRPPHPSTDRCWAGSGASFSLTALLTLQVRSWPLSWLRSRLRLRFLELQAGPRALSAQLPEETLAQPDHCPVRPVFCGHWSPSLQADIAPACPAG